MSQQFSRGTLMPSASSGGQCEAGDSTYRAPILFGTYPLSGQSAIDHDIAMFGPYAEGDDGSQKIVFSTFMGFNHRVLTPLEKFGFVLHPGHMSECYGKVSGQRVECPAPGDPTTLPLPERHCPERTQPVRNRHKQSRPEHRLHPRATTNRSCGNCHLGTSHARWGPQTARVTPSATS